MAGDPYAGLTTPQAWRGYYEEEGYVVVRGAIPQADCRGAREAFEREHRGAPTAPAVDLACHEQHREREPCHRSERVFESIEILGKPATLRRLQGLRATL